MTTLTMPGRGTLPRPVPWRRMAWVTWPQHRSTLAGIGALLGVASAYVLVMGLQLHHAYAPVAACRPATSDLCQRVANDFDAAYAPGAGILFGLLQLVPGLVGAFAGAPVLARELETGTFRYAWTQGIGRARWTVAKLVPLALAAAAATAAFSALFSWSYRPLIATSNGHSPLDPDVFDLRGAELAAWTLAAFAIGTLAGFLIRRVLPAMFATLAASAALAFLTGAYLRRHYEAPVVTADPTIGAPNWILSQTWTAGGRPATLSMLDGALHPVGVRAVTFEEFQPGPGTPDNFDPVQYLAQHGFTQVTVYQPAARYGLFQWIEGGWLLALSVLLLGGTVWLVRRRAA